MYSRSRILEAALAGVALAAIGACGRSDQTSVAQAVPDHPSTQGTPVSPLFPGGGSPPPPDPQGATYDGNAQAIAEGKRLFDWYNCSGCHFHGAGGIGPSLIDSTWTYGEKIDQIYASIYQGRPNGMPSWGAKLSATEIWELAAYIRSAAKDAESLPVPIAPPPAVPIGEAKTVDAPTPAIVDLPPANATSSADAPKP
jgi:cytochrome c oxidase cbb3-type subunit 3